MTARRPADVLREARRRDSANKRDRVVATVEAMMTRGEQVSFAAVARKAGVSNWLVYAPGVREHIDQARARQATQPQRDRQVGTAVSAASLLTDLEHCRAQNRALRAERDQLKVALQRSLGHQADQLANAPLVERINELTALAQQVTGERDQARREKADLEQRLSETEDDLAAARTSLRRMIRSENTPGHDVP